MPFLRYVIDTHQGLVYVPVPKAACTSVKAALGLNQGLISP